MEKKHSKTKSTKDSDRAWRAALKRGECIYGCKLADTPCEHLESYLNQTTSAQPKNSIKLYGQNDIDLYYNIYFSTVVERDLHASLTEEQRKAIHKELDITGLAPHEIDMFIDRTCGQYSWAELTEKYKFGSVGATRYYYKIIETIINKSSDNLSYRKIVECLEE